MWLYLPGIAGAIIGHAFLPNRGTTEFFIFAFVAKGFFDSGHVYTTIWRTLLHKEERQRLLIYLWLPPALFILFYFWIRLGWPYLAALIIYATFFHNVRQFYGISRWYQRLNRKVARISDYFLYSNCLLPFAIFHFMTLPKTSYFYYAGESALFYPDYRWEGALKIVYAGNLVAWGVFELWRMRTSFELNRILSVALPSMLYGTSFLLPASEASIVFPLVLAHGAAYFALNAYAMNKTQARFAKYGVAMFAIVITALFFGSIEFFLDDTITDVRNPRTAILGALFLMPAFSHYIFDMWIWKRSHPESKLLY